MKFSVVMAVYKNDKPEWLGQAIDSLLGQTVLSDDVVIVVDGPLTSELNKVIRCYETNKTISITRLRENKGLGNALNVGIKKAKHELIARMDADDIAVSNRFELQAAEFEKKPNLDILGGQIAEFVGSPDNIVAYRNVPLLHADIRDFARRRSPFNHPTVMYKKSIIQGLDGYDVAAVRIEDYDLWLRALNNGVVCENIDTVLLKYRSTNDAMKRRKTTGSLKSHVRFRIRFFQKGYITSMDLAYGMVSQLVIFMLPSKLAETLFKKVVR